MVNYPDLSNLNSSSNIGNLLALPNASYPFFWAWILGGFWFIITSTLYFVEKEKTGRGRILASMSISSFTIITLAIIGTLFGIITLEIMIYLLVINLIIIGVWFFSTK